MTRTTLRLTCVWLLLVGLTLMALATGAVSAPSRVAAFTVVVAAMVKVRFVVVEFMEVGSAPWPLRLAMDAWVIGLAAVLLILLG